MELFKNSQIPCRFFLYFWNAIFKILDILLDVCKKCSVTCMELFKNSENPFRFFIFLKYEFHNCWYFIRRMQKMLRHIEGVIQK